MLDINIIIPELSQGGAQIQAIRAANALARKKRFKVNLIIIKPGLYLSNSAKLFRSISVIISFLAGECDCSIYIYILIVNIVLNNTLNNI